MTSVQDSLIYNNILSHPATAKIWSDKTRTEYYLDFESALARAQAKLQIIPQKAADEIVKARNSFLIDWDKYRLQTENIGYPVLGVVKQLVSHVNIIEDGLGEWAHWGATTQDVTDTATVMQIRDTLMIVEGMVEEIISSLVNLCEKYKSTPMPARSNLQQAVPMTVGFKFARLLSSFLQHRTRLNELRSRVLVLEFGGAAGTLATLSPSGDDTLGLDCQAELAKELDLAIPSIAWHTSHEAIAEYGSFLTVLTSTCAKFALDMKLEMQTEVGEMSEPYEKDRGSSSTMPQKRNPIASVYVTATASSVRQMSTLLAESVVGDHERSTGPWEIEWIILPQISTLAAACLRHTKDTLAGLEINEAAMRRNLDMTNGLIVSEAVMMELGKTIGRQYAHDLVYDLCRKASTSGRHLVDLLYECKEVELTRSELERLCDPANYLGLSVRMTDRVLDEAKKL